MFKKAAALQLLLLIASHFCFAQQNDTLVVKYNAKWEPITAGTPSYFGYYWPQNAKWHARDYYIDGHLQMQGTYADKERKIKDGIFTWYHKNGMMKDSCLFVAGKKQGTQLTWDIDGEMRSLTHWHQDHRVDTALNWHKNGQLSMLQVTDSFGNGFYKSMDTSGKILRMNGTLAGGQKSGKWIYKDGNGKKSMEAIYEKDSAINCTCFDENGELETKKDCILEKVAGFKGGVNGWVAYLEKKLKYPKEALDRNKQGTVRIQFVIDKDGTVSETKVLDSPDESLSEEAIRIITSSRQWQPAIQYNRYVTYKHIQGITFRL